MYLKTNTLPQHLQRALVGVGYRRADIEVRPAETLCVRDGGGAGRRAFFFPFDLAQGCGAVTYGSWGGPNMFETRQPDADERDHAIPVNCGICKGSSGEHIYATLYLHPTALAPLLPAVLVLTERQNKILQAWAQLSSAGRKYEFERCRDGFTRPTEDEIATLVGMGLLSRNRAGAVAITTDGRNTVKGRWL